MLGKGRSQPVFSPYPQKLAKNQNQLQLSLMDVNTLPPSNLEVRKASRQQQQRSRNFKFRAGAKATSLPRKQGAQPTVAVIRMKRS